jgi:hypothetical protein
MNVIFADDPPFVLSYVCEEVETEEVEPAWEPPALIAHSPMTLWDDRAWHLDEPAHVLPFSRSRLSDADANDLGVLLGELLVARFRRETVAG